MSRASAGASGRPGASTRARRRAVVGLVASVLAVVLAGCVGLPTRGPVGEGDGAADEPGTVFPLAYSPAADAQPEEIVQGFLAAGAAGLGDNHAVARQYLAGVARTAWQPSEGVVVYSTAEPLDIDRVNETQVSVTLSVAATVDADGRYSESPPGSQQGVVFDVVQDDADQWRISGLGDGVLLSEPIFYSVYRPTSLYFLAPARDMLVPEVRWFPQRNAPTYAVRALLAGPSTWLRDSVATAVPEGTRLAVESVPVDAEGRATVDLTAAVASAGAADRALLKAQLEHTLERLRVSTVDVSIAGLPMVEPPPAEVQSDPSPGGPLQALSDGQLVRLTGGSLEPVEAVGPLGGLDPRDPAAGLGGVPQVLLAGPDRLVLAPTSAEPARTLLGGRSLLAPSVDLHGWVWSGTADSPDSFTAVRADGTTVEVAVAWLDGRTVRSVRVSRDGTRVAIVSAGPDGATVDVAGVVRGESGTPLRVGDRTRVGGRLTNATQAVWVDESDLAVLGVSGTTTGQTMHLVPLAGRTRALPALEGAVAIAAGKGERALYVGTADGTLYTLQGTSWAQVATGVTDPAFPG